eukprot:Pgem_evm1s6896
MFEISKKQWEYIISLMTPANLQMMLGVAQLITYIVNNLNGPVDQQNQTGQRYGRGRQMDYSGRKQRVY